MKAVSVIVLKKQDTILMGRRRDNGKWTTPAGCLNDREEPLAGAIRELAEETGLSLSPAFFRLFATMQIDDKLEINGFVVDIDMAGKLPITIKNDPDKECSEWKWIPIAEASSLNLHVPIPHNIVFLHLGELMKSMGDDIFKSVGHKYIRKYQEHGRWVYIYHDEKKRIGKMTDKEVGLLHDLAGTGHKPSKALLDDAKEVKAFDTKIFGFDGLKRWTLIDRPEGVHRLQSLDDLEIYMRVVDPKKYFPDFDLKLSDVDEKKLGDKSDRVVMVTMSRGDDKINLKAPIVFNTKTGVALQVMNMSKKNYGTRHSIEKSEKLKGGLADGKPDSDFDPKQLKAGIKVESEHTTDKKAQKEVAKDHLTEDKDYYKKLKKIEKKKSMLHVIDLFKAAAHKYLRKYRMHGEWVYVYTNSKGHRRLKPEEVQLVHRLAETEHKKSKALVATTKEISQDEVKLVHQLAKTGHAKANRKANEYRDIMGDHYDEFAGEDKRLTEDQVTKAKLAIEKGLDAAFNRLNNYPDSGVAKAIRNAGISKESIQGAIDYTSAKTMLNSLNDQLNKMDTALIGTRSQFSSANSIGGYGNLIYQTSLSQMQVGSHVLPNGYLQIHRRELETLGGKAIGKIRDGEGFLSPDEFIKERDRLEAERIAREKAERAAREEAERREMGGLVDTFGYQLTSMLDESQLRGGSVAATAKDVNRFIKKMFGKTLPKEAFPYDFSDRGIKVKIVSLNIYDQRMSMKFEAYNSAGEKITEKWTRDWNMESGGWHGIRPHIYNTLLITNGKTRGSSNLGALINKRQWDLMTNHAGENGGTVTVSAGLTVGPYMWANTGFSFTSRWELKERQVKLKALLKEKEGIELTEEQLNAFKEPCHFSALDIGKKYELTDLSDHSGNRIWTPLSPKEVETGCLGGDESFPLTDEEIRSGQTNRMAVHFGKWFMLRTGGWHGIWDSKKDTVARKYGREYVNNRIRANDQLGDKWLRVAESVTIRRSIYYFDKAKVHELLKSMGGRYVG